jgi:hypothetical protein
MTDIALELVQRSRIKARHHKKSFNEKQGLLGGFGTLDNLANIQTERTEPVWVRDELKEDKGRWSESVTYTAQLILRCPTPAETRLIQTEVRFSDNPSKNDELLIPLKVHILAKVDFPGIGNTWKSKLGPLPISSGIKSAEELDANQELRTQLDIAVPP